MSELDDLDARTIAAKVNQHLESATGRRLSEVAEVKNFRGVIGTRTVRIEISHSPDLHGYQYNVWLFDEDSGESLAIGNGAPTLDEAMNIYHWGEVGVAMDRWESEA